MNQSLRLLDRQPKPQRHGGLIDSDAVLRRAYERQYEEMTVKYAVVTASRVPWWERARRWLRSIW